MSWKLAEKTSTKSAVSDKTSKFSLFKQKPNIKNLSKKQKKKLFKIVALIVVALIILSVIGIKSGLFSKIFGKDDHGPSSLTTYTVSCGTIKRSLTSTGTIEPVKKSSVTALVQGKVTADHFEEGDIVEKDQLLYQIETTSDLLDLEDRLSDAIDDYNDALEDVENLNVKSDYVGTVEKLYVEVGDKVNVGDKIADIIDYDTMCIDSPFMSVDVENIRIGDTALVTVQSSYETVKGTVTDISPLVSTNALGVKTQKVTISVHNQGAITTSHSAHVSVNGLACTSSSNFYHNDKGTVVSEMQGEVSSIISPEGSKISKNSVVVRLESETLEDRLSELERSVEKARENLDDYDERYNITSPISGTVMSKEYVTGETIGSSSSQGSQTIAQIYDMSAFTFEMSIDELDIDLLKKGQSVNITSSARQGYTWEGTITNISVQGTTQSGATSYPVTVTIYNEEDESKRTVDTDGTIHKQFASGKTSVVKTYSLLSTDGYKYKYSDDIELTAISNNSSKSYMISDKPLRKASDGTYSLNGVIYTLCDDMSTISVETFDESNMLRPGMNVDAEIILESAENVITVPVSAISRGNKVKVLKRADTNPDEQDKSDIPNKPENMPKDFEEKMPEGFDGKMPKNFKQSNNNASYSTEISSDTEYEIVEVTIGVSDENMVEITSGLNVGDVVILDPAVTYAQNNNFQNQMMGGMNMGSMGMSGMGSMGTMQGPPSMMR